MKFFAKILNGLKLLAIFQKSFVVDFRLGSKYAFVTLTFIISKRFVSHQYLNHKKRHPNVFYNKVILKNFAKFIEKDLCWSLLIKRLWHRCFPVNFTKYLRAHFYKRPPGKCLLGITIKDMQ